MSESVPGNFAHPIFVGGVGRSGTHPMGRLVASSKLYTQVVTEARFHVSKGGVADLYYDRTTMPEFLAMMRDFFWERGHPVPQGLHKVTTVEKREEILARFEAGFEADRVEACRRLIKDFLDPAAEEAGRPAWVELTAEVITEAPFLLKLFPEAKFFNMIRDGRVVAAGAARKLLNMTDDPIQALQRWEKMVRSSQAGMDAIPDDRVMIVPLDSLTALDREAMFDQVVEFLDIRGTNLEAMRKFFDKSISGERANVGRWRQRLSPRDVRMVDRRYRKIQRQLHREGIHWIPDAEPRQRGWNPLRKQQPQQA